MFIVRETNRKTSNTSLQVFKLLGNWGAVTVDGTATFIGFSYADLNDLLVVLMKKMPSFEVLPGPTVRLTSYNNQVVWTDYFSNNPKHQKLDEDSCKILCPPDQPDCIINLVYQGGKYLLIDSQTGGSITPMTHLKEPLQKAFLALCKKYKA